MIRKVVSGGQTGTDQAALQAAIDSGLDHGGWCPPGRICESGLIPERFNLSETPKECDSSATDIPRSQRTIWNVRDSDASLIFIEEGQRDNGTELGIETAKKLNKPYLVVDPASSDAITTIRKWINEINIEILSIGGPSENSSPGICERVYQILMDVFSS